MNRHVSPNTADPATANEGIHFERNCRIFATDGPVGTLRQVVVDEATGEITMLAVSLDDGGVPILVPSGLVDRSAGSALFLTIDRAQFVRAAARAARLDRSGFRKTDPKRALRNAALNLGAALPLVGSLSGDSLVTKAAGSPVAAQSAAAPEIPDGDDRERSNVSRRLLPFRRGTGSQPTDQPIAVATGG